MHRMWAPGLPRLIRSRSMRIWRTFRRKHRPEIRCGCLSEPSEHRIFACYNPSSRYHVSLGIPLCLQMGSNRSLLTSISRSRTGRCSIASPRLLRPLSRKVFPSTPCRQVCLAVAPAQTVRPSRHPRPSRTTVKDCRSKVLVVVVRRGAPPTKKSRRLLKSFARPSMRPVGPALPAIRPLAISVHQRRLRRASCQTACPTRSRCSTKVILS